MLIKIVLSKTVKIDQKLTFNVFHILNQCCISKIEKMWRTVSQFLPLKKKRTIPDRIRRVEATNDDNEECRTTIAPETPLKNDAQWMTILFGGLYHQISHSLSIPPSFTRFFGFRRGWVRGFSFKIGARGGLEKYNLQYPYYYKQEDFSKKVLQNLNLKCPYIPARFYHYLAMSFQICINTSFWKKSCGLPAEKCTQN